MSAIDPAVKGQAASVGLSLFRRVEQYFENPNHRKEFEKWYEKQYHQKYVWKRQ